ncbi:hypothetical protein SAMN05443246_0922 [Paenibacillus sp. GP183]|nr:hypothetical protein SAMN05443246_0922 [Paenibacillus sp. GP183]
MKPCSRKQCGNRLLLQPDLLVYRKLAKTDDIHISVVGNHLKRLGSILQQEIDFDFPMGFKGYAQLSTAFEQTQSKRSAAVL